MSRIMTLMMRNKTTESDIIAALKERETEVLRQHTIQTKKQTM